MFEIIDRKIEYLEKTSMDIDKQIQSKYSEISILETEISMCDFEEDATSLLEDIYDLRRDIRTLESMQYEVLREIDGLIEDRVILGGYVNEN